MATFNRSALTRRFTGLATSYRHKTSWVTFEICGTLHDLATKGSICKSAWTPQITLVPIFLNMKCLKMLWVFLFLNIGPVEYCSMLYE